jgi:CBS domain containing-hemolysin-like protein
VAEILGDSVEADSTEEPTIRILDDQTYLVQAQVNLEEVNEALHLDLPLTDEYQTLGGFVLFRLQRIPQPGELLYYGGYEFMVTAAEGPRLDQIRIHRLQPPEPNPENDTNGTAPNDEPSDRPPL